MRSYVGPLLDSLDGDLPESVSECSADDSYNMHLAAKHQAITAICVGQHVRLVRRKLLPSHEEIPGEVAGFCYGSSHHSSGRAYLAIQLYDDETVLVDVTNPHDWVWEVSSG